MWCDYNKISYRLSQDIRSQKKGVLLIKQETRFYIDKTIKANEQKMPIITCKCGEQILVVPDLTLMGEAIKRHLNKCKVTDEQYLTNEVIKALSKIVLTQ